jgi:histidinol-phosphatase
VTVTTPALLLEAVAEVARLTSEIAMRYFKSDLTVLTKSDGSPVTIADREAEERARKWVASRFPGDAVLGEEFGATGNPNGRRWFIDPIDGTKTFVRGVPFWGSMIAVQEGDDVLAGAIACPAVGECIVAATGCGCWWNGARCHASAEARLDQATILTTDDRFRYNPDRVARWQALGERVAVSRTWGDCYGYLLVATGRAELMVDDRLSPWDSTPLIPLIHEAGGVFSDWRGRVGIAGEDGVASNAPLADACRLQLGIPEAKR